MVEISVVICFRDWGLDRLALALRSLQESVVRSTIEVIVSDFGSVEVEELRSVIEANGAVHVRTETSGPWSRSRALNAGVAAAKGRYVVTTDADMLFTPEALGMIRSRLEQDSRSVQLLQCRDLPPRHSASTIEEFEWDAYEKSSKFRPRWGMGGMIAFPVEAYELIRGYDERMVIYGGEDIDFANRLRRAGYRLNWIEDSRCRIYHIWHESSRKSADESSEGRAAIEKNKNIVEQDKTWVRNLSWIYPRSKDQPLVTVAVTTYNRAEYLRDCIESVLSQAVSDIEVVVVDDGSSDNTEEIAADFEDSRVRYFYQDNAGVSAARNRALAEARAPFIVIQDDDDIMLPWRISAHFAALQQGDHGTYGGWVDFDNTTGVMEPRPGKEFGLPQLLYSGGVMAHGTLMVRTDVLRSFGYRTEFRAGTDYNLAIRMAMAGIRLRHTGEFHILRRFHGGNLTSTISDHQKESARKTTNLYRRRFIPAIERKYREEARSVKPAQCTGEDKLKNFIGPHLPDGLVVRMASVPAKDSKVHEAIMNFANDQGLVLQVFRATDEVGKLADRNCCLYNVSKTQIRALREAGHSVHVELIDGMPPAAGDIDAVADVALGRVIDALSESKDQYHAVVMIESGSVMADQIWGDESLYRRLVVVNQMQLLVGIDKFLDIDAAASREAEIQASYGPDVRTFLIKAAD